jgi:hypothetical protein
MANFFMKLFTCRKFSIFLVKQKLMKIYEQVESAYNFTIYLSNTRFNIIFLRTSSSTKLPLYLLPFTSYSAFI